MGIEEAILPGGLFPLCSSPVEASTLEGLLWQKGNQPSFMVASSEGGKPPGLALLKEYFGKGYASRYTSVEAARAKHGELIISPLGTITKVKPDGSVKDRIIQDLTRV